MAAEYQQYQSSPEAQKANMVNIAANRLDTYIGIGHDHFVDGPKFFKDVYLLKKAGYFNIHPEKVGDMQRLASYPVVRTDFFKTLKDQDAAGASEEILASIEVGEAFEYNMDRRNNHFRVLFDALKVKHEKLIKDEEDRKAAEATTWGPPESNVGKSPEWIAAQDKVAKIWEDKSKTLPQGVDRETGFADLRYLETGFGILKEQILSDPPKSSVEVRAMIEYLMHKIWNKGEKVKTVFIDNEPIGRRRKPSTFNEVGVIPKALFIPEEYKSSVVPANEDQRLQVRKIYRGLTKAMHPDLGSNPNVDKKLVPQVETLLKAVTRNWGTVSALVPTR